MRFRRRSGTVEAWRFSGENGEAIILLADAGRIRGSATGLEVFSAHGVWVPVKLGEWIVKADDQDWYPIAHEKFMARYESDEE